MFVECKWDDAPTSPALKYLKTRFPDCDSWQISAVGKKDFVDGMGIRVAPAAELLRNLI